jgi:hypothetical protein
MSSSKKFYVDGAWIEPSKPRLHDVVNAATEEVVGQISFGSAEDVDRAVGAARRAFETYSKTSAEYRIAARPRALSARRIRRLRSGPRATRNVHWFRRPRPWCGRDITSARRSVICG